MKKYQLEDIKKGWQDDETVNNYDEKRFMNLSGKASDLLDKFAIKRALSRIDKSTKILDLPCGTGRIMHYLYHISYKNITGSDISAQMLNVAKNRMKRKREVSFVRSDAEHTQFHDDTFGAIVSIRFMGHIPKETRVSILREFARICKGNIIVEYPVRDLFACNAKKMLRVLTVRARLPEQWEWHDVSKGELEEEFREAGIKIIRKIKKLPFLSESTYVVARGGERLTENGN